MLPGQAGSSSRIRITVTRPKTVSHNSNLFNGVVAQDERCWSREILGSQENKEEVVNMRNPNAQETFTQPKEDDGMKNGGRRLKKDIPKVIYAPDLPDPYRSTQPYVACPMQYYDDYD